MDSLSIDPDRIHIWRLWIAEYKRYVSRFEKILNAEEKNIAAERATEIEKSRYIIVRALVKLLLSSYTSLHPCRIKLTPGTYGKPVLPMETGKNVSFNISHAGDAAVIAFCQDCEIGVDVERKRSNLRLDDIVDYSFTEEEKQYLNQLNKEHAAEQFFSLWSKKEALIKAAGGSVALHMDCTSVLGPPGPDGWIEAALGDTSLQWYLYEFDPFPGYSGALCAGSARYSIFFQQLSLEYFQDILHNSSHLSL